MTIAVLGAGAFGTALAISLAGSTPVVLWARSVQQADALASTRRNDARLPGAVLPPRITITAIMADIGNLDTVLLAVPMQQLRGFLTEHRTLLGSRQLVACCKGAEIGTGLGPVGVIRQVLPDAGAAILTGPSFASDIAAGLPTALTLACADDNRARELQARLGTANLRIYRTTDVVGAEMGGALKNVCAIGCGAVIGAGLGDSARAALMTRGYAEMQRYATALGALPDTLAGLSGLGDLALTCTSDQSRNYRRGLALGRGEPFDTDTTVEGAATAQAVSETAARLGIEMPVTGAVLALLNGERTIDELVGDMLARPLKAE